MSQQLQITGGAKVRSLEGVITGTSGVLNSLPINAANGIPQLDSSGKILVSQLPNSVMEYQGTWNVTTNTPYLVNGVGNAGDVYIVTNAAVGGTNHNFGSGNILFYNGDQAIYDGSAWQRASGSSGTVTSVALTTPSAFNVTGSPITTSGTLAITGAGTSSQYINGTGSLTTFPTLITSIGLSMPSAFNVSNSPLTANGAISVTGSGSSAQYIDGTGALQSFPSLTGYVPYTGATSDVDLGVHVLNAQALHVKGTAGNGHLGLKHQSASPTGSANESLLFADVNGDLGWQNGNLYSTTLSTHSNTANRTYTFPDATGTIALTSDIPTVSGTANYIPKFTGTNSIGNSVISYNSGSNFDEINISQASTPNYNTISVFANTESRLYLNSSNNDRLIAYNSYGVVALKYESSTSSNFLLRYDGYSTKNLTIQTNGSDRITVNSAGIFRLNAYTTNGLLKTSNADGTFAIATAGTDYVIPSALSSYVPYTGATTNLDLGSNDLTSYAVKANILEASLNGTASSPLILRTGTSGFASGLNAISLISSPTSANTLTIISNASSITKTAQIGLGSLTATRTYTLPDASGTIALTSDISYPVTSVFGRTGAVVAAEGDYSLTQLSDVTITSPTNGQVLKYNGTTWINGTDTDTGITSLNGLTALTQTFAVGTSGTDFNISSVTSTHTFNLPTASATNRGALSSADWTTFNNKQNALTNPVTGTGTSGRLAYWSGTSTQTSSGSLTWDNTYSALYSPVFYALNPSGAAINISSNTDNVGKIQNVTATSWSLAYGTGNLAFPLGTSVLTWNDSGKVGIGNTTPTYTLDVTGTVRGTTSAYFSTASGNVGIGTTSANKLGADKALTINGATDSLLELTVGDVRKLQMYHGGTNAQLNNLAAGSLTLITNGISAITIASAGNVGIGTSSPDNKLGILGANNTTPQSDGISIYANNTTVYTKYGWGGLSAQYDYLMYTAGSERMRITSGGAISVNGAAIYTGTGCINTTVSTSGDFMFVGLNTNASNPRGLYLRNSATTGGDYALYFEAAGAAKFYVNGNGVIYSTNTSVQGISDVRHKENIRDLDKGLTEVLLLKPRLFDWKEGKGTGNKNVMGFIAQEVESIFPELISNWKETVDATESFKTIAISNIIPYLTKAIQEQQAQIEELSKQNEELSNRLNKAGL